MNDVRFCNELFSTLEVHETAQVLQIYDDIGLTKFLSFFPFQKISLLSKVIINNSEVNGIYSYRGNYCEIGVLRSEKDFGQVFSYQNFYSLSSLATYPTRAIQVTAIHELGHHVHAFLQKSYPQFFRKTMQIPIVFGLSQYSRKDNLEYFAECFSAFVFCRAKLLQHDQIGYNMITEVLEILEMEVKEIP
jgi:hypothetical protein